MLQTYKSLGDVTAGKEMYEYYSDVHDCEEPHFISLREIVLDRKQPRKMFVQHNTQIQEGKLLHSVKFRLVQTFKNEPPHDKTNKMACAPSKDSDQPGHPPSLIRVFAVRMKKGWVLSYPLSAQQRLWSDWVDAQADLSLCWAHMPLCWFCRQVAQIALMYLYI